MNGKVTDYKMMELQYRVEVTGGRGYREMSIKGWRCNSELR